MTQGLVRYQQTGGLHFVTFSCYQRRPYLGAAEARDVFERALEAMRLRYDFFVSGYVVMPEHVHLLVSEPGKAGLAEALQAVKLSVTVKRTERPFWWIGTTTSTCIPRQSGWRSCGRCTRTRWLVGWRGLRRTGCGRVLGPLSLKA